MAQLRDESASVGVFGRGRSRLSESATTPRARAAARIVDRYIGSCELELELMCGSHRHATPLHAQEAVLSP